MAIRRLSKRKFTGPFWRRVESRMKGRRLNAAVPMAVELFSGRKFGYTWLRMKTGVARRWGSI